MAKMRATLRKVAQVTPPPSPKNGEDLKNHSEWSTRLRNHSASTTKISNGRRAKIVRIKKEIPTFHNEDSNCSRSSTSSPVCDASRIRTRQTSGEALHYWPRRSARLIGIPAEIDEQQNKSNGSVDTEEEEEEEHRADDEVPEKNQLEQQPADLEDETQDQCKDCKQRKASKQGRTLEALLIESQRFMEYPSKGSGCRMGRSTYNSRDIRPPSTSPRILESDPAVPLPVNVDQVQFSFEIVPTGTSWYQTFLRDEAQGTDPLPEEPVTCPAPFLLPYEMSLEAILKSNRPVRKNNSKGRPRGSTKKTVPLSFRPIISTRLQMQSAARQSQLAAATAATAADKNDCQRHSDRRQRKKAWFNMPRKSPRCHASTMAILCSKSDSEEKPNAAGSEPVDESQPVEKTTKDIPPLHPAPTADGYLVQVLEEVLTQGLEKRPVRKRGRPRKYPPFSSDPITTELVESPLTDLLTTPLERIEDIVDESIIPTGNADDVCLFNDDHLTIDYPAYNWPSGERDGSHPMDGPEIFHDLDSHSGSRSSSVYETASEIGSTSTSTGTCDSRRKAWRSNRRKRRNMTGWPRSKRRRPAALNLINVDEDLNLTGDLSCNADDAIPVLSPIREESVLTDVSDSQRPQSQPRASFVSKPFQFQRKTLRFVGKRILRPAAQRHAPQRLEYWPCFPTESTGSRRKRKTS